MAEVLQMPAAQPNSAKFKVSAIIDGFPVEVEMEGTAGNLQALITKLKSLGAVPTSATGSISPNASAPKCPVHNKPMKASRKPGSYFCPHKRDDGEYCQERG
jgi:hypothetical protein